MTLEVLEAMWPNGNTKVAGLLEGIAEAAPVVFAKYGLDSDLVIAHVMAQFSVECGAGTTMTENINYSAARACQVWPNRFTSEAECYAKVGSFDGDPDFPIRLIDSVYGARNGNRAGTDDGSLFIGRGLSQVTGRANYEALGTKVDLDLVSQPDLVNAADIALECGVADFVLCGCLPFAENDDVTRVTERLNGGDTGLEQRKAWLLRWKTALGVQARHSMAWVQETLNKLGADPVLATDGDFGPQSVRALKAFQSARGLAADGKVGPVTLAALDAALLQ